MSKFSIKDRLAKSIAPLKRKLVDKVVSIEGSPVNVLKVSSVDVGMSGDKETAFEFSILSDVIMRFPVNEVELVEGIDVNNNTEVFAFDLMELLPTKMVVYFDGNYETEASKVKVSDLIIHVLYDENNNKIPIIFEVSRPLGRVMASRYIVKREWELRKYRGVSEDDIMLKIQEYLDNLNEFE